MSELSALDVVRATSDPIHTIGGTIFMHRQTFARAGEWGWQNPIAFYAAGRGGVLGDVDASIVASAFGWFSPGMVAPIWNEGVSVSGAAGAAARMAEATALWGRDHLTGAPGLDRFNELAEKLVDGAGGSGLPLFVGWRNVPRPSDAPAKAAILLQTLREWRGAVHLIATTAVGLSPLEAILTNEGEGQAKLFGWAEPFPDCSALKGKHDEAEVMTDALLAKEVERLLTPAERGDFAAAVEGIQGALK